MSGRTTILLIGADARTAGLLAAQLEDCEVLAASPGEALAAAQSERPDFVVAARGANAAGILERCRLLKRDADLTAAGLVVDALRAENEALEKSLQEGACRFIPVLTALAEVTSPGASDRIERIAEIARKLALRLEVPEPFLRDLDIAAKLLEVGRAAGSAPGAQSEDTAPASNEWRHAVSAREMLREVEGLQDAVELIGNVYENWDGTGHPDRLQRGQIPVRARILRLAADFVAALDAAGAAGRAEISARLEAYVGTRYDPIVWSQFEALLEEEAKGGGACRRLRMPILGLIEGMVLAEDLYTSGGIKLLARGTTLTRSTLETILQRHRFDPMLHGAVVNGDSA